VLGSFAFTHIKDAYDKGFYIECIAMLDSMLTDRVDSYCQFISHYDDRQFVPNSLFDAIRNLGILTKEKGVRDEEFKPLNNKIEEWSSKRNCAVHGFVMVNQKTKGHDLEGRRQDAKETVEEGMKLVREVMGYTQKRIKPST
jgi:hypothetical protein